MSGKNESLRLAPDQTRHGFADLLSDLCGCREATLPVGFGFQSSQFQVFCFLRLTRFPARVDYPRRIRNSP